MEHFHVIRWSSVRLTNGEKIPVTDLDYASLATVGEARAVQDGLSSRGDRCASYPCVDAYCTLHAPRLAGACR